MALSNLWRNVVIVYGNAVVSCRLVDKQNKVDTVS
jgi:hypothetical protein